MHVTFGDAAGAAVSAAFHLKINDRLIFSDDLSVGPIAGLTTTAGRRRRVLWWAQILKNESDRWLPNDGPAIQALRRLRGKRFLCWCGPNATEQLGFRRFLSVLPRGYPASVIFLPVGPKGIEREVGHWTPGRLRPFLRRESALSAAAVSRLKDEWRILSRKNAPFRMLEADGSWGRLSQNDIDQRLIALGAGRHLPALRIVADALAFGLTPRNIPYLKSRIAKLRKENRP